MSLSEFMVRPFQAPPQGQMPRAGSLSLAGVLERQQADRLLVLVARGMAMEFDWNETQLRALLHCVYGMVPDQLATFNLPDLKQELERQRSQDPRRWRDAAAVLRLAPNVRLGPVAIPPLRAVPLGSAMPTALPAPATMAAKCPSSKMPASCTNARAPSAGRRIAAGPQQPREKITPPAGSSAPCRGPHRGGAAHRSTAMRSVSVQGGYFLYSK